MPNNQSIPRPIEIPIPIIKNENAYFILYFIYLSIPNLPRRTTAPKVGRCSNLLGGEVIYKKRPSPRFERSSGL